MPTTGAENSSEAIMLPFSRLPPLRAYLRCLRSHMSAPPSNRTRTVFVLGNPSADLDSFISAIVFSYFYNYQPKYSPNQAPNDRVYIPLLNLPKTPSAELCRLRPEFVLALQSADAWHHPSKQALARADRDSSTKLIDSLLTIKDLTSSPNTSLFRAGSTAPEAKQELILVDHNAPSIPGLTSNEISSRFSTIGCIDHHVDENYVPTDSEPRIIRTSIGSCTSLVVAHLRDNTLSPSSETFSDADQKVALQQLATLALAPILIDTRNLTDTNKTSDLDHKIAAFLKSSILSTDPQGGKFTPPSASGTHSASVFLTQDYHSLLSDAKAHSLDNLTMSEVFDRDYKQWSESSASKISVEIGISSLVQPIGWLISHAGSVSEFVFAIQSFAKEYKLDIFMFNTRPTNRGKGFGAVAFSDAGEAAIKRFEQRSGNLGLNIYDENKDLDEAMSEAFGSKWRVWYMTKIKNTRKQIAPLIRECVNSQE
jgi:exopolyphosphatase